MSHAPDPPPPDHSKDPHKDPPKDPREIDPDRHFPPPDAPHAAATIPDNMEEIRDTRGEDKDQITEEIILPLEKLGPDIRWYLWPFFQPGDLAVIGLGNTEYQGEIALFSERLAALCVYTVKGAEELADPDRVVVPGQPVTEEEDFETLLFLHLDYARKSPEAFDQGLAEALVKSCEYIHDATLRFVIDGCLDPLETDPNEVRINDVITWHVLRNYVIRLKEQGRLRKSNPNDGLPGPEVLDPDHILRFMAKGWIVRQPVP